VAYKLEISGRAAKDIKALDTVVQRRIASKLKFFITQEDPLSLARKLVNAKDGDYWWRVGHYRVVFDVEGSTILILRIQHRSEVYKD
jgi:mRNA interferase RelE/StbE